jgi:hypothetical protein
MIVATLTRKNGKQETFRQKGDKLNEDLYNNIFKHFEIQFAEYNEYTHGYEFDDQFYLGRFKSRAPASLEIVDENGYDVEWEEVEA